MGIKQEAVATAPCLDPGLLKNELKNIMADDQKYRLIATDMRRQNQGLRTKEEIDYWNLQRGLDSLNMVKVENIIRCFGYPGKDMVGDELKSVAAMVIIHNPKGQEKYLDMLWDEAENENVKKAEIAILHDRILMFKGAPQIYGTAMKYDTVGFDASGLAITRLKVWKINDFKNLDKRREQVGWYSFKKQCELEGIDINQFEGYRFERNMFDF